MYSVIRIIIGCVLFALMVIAIRKSKAVNTRLLYCAAVCVSAALIHAMMFIPVENSFMSFDSPEAALRYYNPAKRDIELIVSGEECDFIVSSKGDASELMTLPKTADGWKIGIGSNMKTAAHHFAEGISISVYQHRGSDDYFVRVFNSAGGESDLSDSCGTSFSCIKKANPVLGKEYVTYYGRIDNFSSEYNVTVDGKVIFLSE